MRLARWKSAVIDELRGQAGIARARQPGSIGTIGNDTDDLRLQFSIGNRLMNRREVRAAPRQKDREPHYSIHDAKPAGGASYVTRPEPFTTLPTKK